MLVVANSEAEKCTSSSWKRESRIVVLVVSGLDFVIYEKPPAERSNMATSESQVPIIDTGVNVDWPRTA